MMKVAAAFALAFSTALAEANPPRVAVIRVADVFRQLEGTVKATEEIKAKQAGIASDSRQLTYNRLYADLQARQKVLDDKRAPLDEETRKRLLREFAQKQQEAKSVWDDLESFRAERNREIDSEMVSGMKQRLALIHTTTEKLAREEGYDWVIDASGNTNTGVPMLLYAKNPSDLTEQVLAALGKAEKPAQPISSQPSPVNPANGQKR